MAAAVDLSRPVCAVPGEVTRYAGRMPRVSALVSVDPYAPQVTSRSCDPRPKPGVVAFRKLVLESLGGRDLGICRECSVGGSSQHHEGRAWDWGMMANDPSEKARVEQLMSWLLAPDPISRAPHANFRRAGLRYMIWDRRIWSPMHKEWRPYSGRHSHSDHVHLSWGWPGARAETSLYRWLGVSPTSPAGRVPGLASGPGLGPGLALGVGAAAGWLLLPWVMDAL